MSDSNFRASTFFRGIYILNSEHADRNSNGMFKWRNYWMEHVLQRIGTRLNRTNTPPGYPGGVLFYLYLNESIIK